MSGSSRERNRSCSLVSRRSRGRIANPPLHQREREESRLAIRRNPQNRICKEVALQRPKTGKFDYLSAPNHPAHSMAFKFFTDDCLTVLALPLSERVRTDCRLRRTFVREMSSIELSAIRCNFGSVKSDGFASTLYDPGGDFTFGTIAKSTTSNTPILGPLFASKSFVHMAWPSSNDLHPIWRTRESLRSKVVSRLFRTFGLAERRPALAYAVMAPLIC